jgi:hypothetical protein
MNRAAGIVVVAVPMIIKAMGKVARPGEGAIAAPTMPPNKTTIGAPVWVKAAAIVRILKVLYWDIYWLNYRLQIVDIIH